MGILKSYIAGDASPVENLNQLTYERREGPLVKKRIPTAISDEGPKSNEISRRVDDVVRITKMFTRANGIQYLANEVYLNTLDSEPTLERKDKAGNIIQNSPIRQKVSQLSKGLLTTAKVVGSTLAQVAVSGTGLHFIRAFDKRDKRYFSYPQYAGESDGLAGIADKGQTKDLVDKYSSRVLPISAIIASIESDGTGALSAMATVAPPEEAKQINLYTQNDTDYRKESRILLGNIDKRQNRTKYSLPDETNTISDLINRAEPYKSEGVAGISKTRDIIKFRFAVVTPEDTTYLHFRAFLKDFSDDFAGNWDSYSYIGRGENFYTYNGFDRNISFNFTVAAQTRQELAPIYRKLVYLASSTAPTYSDGGYMRGTFTRVTIGDYIWEMPGIIESVNYNWRDGYPWEIALDSPEEGGDKEMQELPMVLDCSVRFKPIHKFVPETGLKHYITTDGVDMSKNPETLFFKDGNPMYEGVKRNFYTSESEALYYSPAQVTAPKSNGNEQAFSPQSRGSLESGF